jgi:hypothetical protein
MPTGKLVRSKALLLGLTTIGVLLYFFTAYTAFHPHLLIARIAVDLLVLYLVAVPIVLWRMHGERLLRILLGGIWLVYVLLLCFGAWSMMQD